MHIWRRHDPECHGSECGWEREEISDAGLSLGCAPAGRLEIARCPACRAVHHEGALSEKPEEVWE